MVTETRAWCWRYLHVNSTVHFILYVNGESNNAPNIKLWTQIEASCLKIQRTWNDWPNYSPKKSTVFLLHSVGMTNAPGGRGLQTNVKKKKKAFSLILMQRQTQTYEHNLTLLGKHIWWGEKLQSIQSLHNGTADGLLENTIWGLYRHFTNAVWFCRRATK